MADTNNQEKPRPKGQVRIRSNVCTDPNGWHLVPGDVLKRHGLHYDGVNARQHEEMMYYEACSICKRRIYEIDEDGCDHPICRRQGIPSSAEAARRKSRYLDNSGSNVPRES